MENQRLGIKFQQINTYRKTELLFSKNNKLNEGSILRKLVDVFSGMNEDFEPRINITSEVDKPIGIMVNIFGQTC